MPFLKQHIDKRQLSWRLLAALERPCFRECGGMIGALRLSGMCLTPIPTLQMGVGFGNGTGMEELGECVLERIMPRLAVAHMQRPRATRAYLGLLGTLLSPKQKGEQSQPAHLVHRRRIAPLLCTIPVSRALFEKDPDAMQSGLGWC